MLKNFNRKLFCLLLTALFSAAFAQTAATTAKQTAKSWSNPVFDADFPDPTVIRAGDGFFYAYATQAVVGAVTNNIQLARSADLVNWERLPDALPEKSGLGKSDAKNLGAARFLRRRKIFYVFFRRPEHADRTLSGGRCRGQTDRTVSGFGQAFEMRREFCEYRPDAV